MRVYAAGVNPPDWYLREGCKMLPPEWRPPISFPLIPGTDVSGVVEAVANDVTDFAVGDEVYSMIRFPAGRPGDSAAYAEYVAIPAQEVARKPGRIDHVHAAGAPMALLTAWQFLVDLGHDEPNPLQPNRHQPVPLEGKTALLETNGTLAVTQAMLPLLRRSAAGRIVNLSSSLGSLTLNGDPASPYYAARLIGYNASKAALNMLTVQLAEELKGTSIVVNSVSPGYVKTDLTGHNGFMTAEQGTKLPVRYALLGENAVSGKFVEPSGETPW